MLKGLHNEQPLKYKTNWIQRLSQEPVHSYEGPQWHMKLHHWAKTAYKITRMLGTASALCGP